MLFIVTYKRQRPDKHGFEIVASAQRGGFNSYTLWVDSDGDYSVENSDSKTIKSYGDISRKKAISRFKLFIDQINLDESKTRNIVTEAIKEVSKSPRIITSPPEKYNVGDTLSLGKGKAKIIGVPGGKYHVKYESGDESIIDKDTAIRMHLNRTTREVMDIDDPRYYHVTGSSSISDRPDVNAIRIGVVTEDGWKIIDFSHNKALILFQGPNGKRYTIEHIDDIGDEDKKPRLSFKESNATDAKRKFREWMRFEVNE